MIYKQIIGKICKKDGKKVYLITENGELNIPHINTKNTYEIGDTLIIDVHLDRR